MKLERGSGPLSMASLIAGAVIVVMVGVATWLGHWAADERTSEPSRTGSSMPAWALGPVQLAVPAEWRRLPMSAARIVGIEKLPTQVFDLGPGLSARAVVTVASPALTASASLMPEPVQDAAARPPGRPREGQLDGRRAWMYLAVPVKRARETMEVTVVPTTAGVVAIACLAPTLTFSTAADCASGVQLSLERARPIRPTADLAFRFRIGAVARRLDGERVEQRAALARARTRGAQTLAAHRLALQHATAARALAPLVGSDTTASVVASLRNASRRYEQLARSATARDRAGFSRAARAIDEADRRLVDAWDAVLPPAAPQSSTA